MFIFLFTIKLIIIIVSVIIISRIFLLRKSIKGIIVIISSVLIVFVISQKLLECLPVMKDEVTLIAIGNEDTSSFEQQVELMGYTIDGVYYNALDHLKIIEGHWLWTDKTLCWYSTMNNRLLYPVSNQLVLEIPVGYNRTLEFVADAFHGHIEILTKKGEWIVDTYAPTETIISVQIGQSSRSLLVLEGLRIAISFFLFFFILFICVIILLKYIFKSIEDICWIEKYKGRLMYGSIALITLIVMFHFADKISLWADEMHQIGITNGTIVKAVHSCLIMEEVSPPLPLIIYTLWYHLAPYGEEFLLLVPMILIALSIYLVGRIGELLQGRCCGILAAILIASSSIIWIDAAYEYRSYPFLIFFSCLSLYCYVLRNIKKKFLYDVLWSIATGGLAMSHYFGMIACAAFFVGDIYLLCKKELSWRIIIPYIVIGSVSGIWLGLVVSSVLENGQVAGVISWQPVPGMNNIRELLYFISGNETITYVLLLLAVSYAFCYRKKSKIQFWECYYLLFMAINIIVTILLLYLWGNVNTSHTMWANRYFFALVPYSCILSALFIGYYMKQDTRRMKVVCLALGLYLSINCCINVTALTSVHPYREAADWVYSQSPDIYYTDTIVMHFSVATVTDGWSDYYLTRQGKRDKLNVVRYGDISGEEILNYNKIYALTLNMGYPEPMKQFLDDNYVLVAQGNGIDAYI